jgi:hypothetical protein
MNGLKEKVNLYSRERSFNVRLGKGFSLVRGVQLATINATKTKRF